MASGSAQPSLRSRSNNAAASYPVEDFSDLLADEYEILVLDESGRRTFHEFMRVEPYRVTFVEIAHMSKMALARDLSPSSDKRDSQM